MTNNTQNKPVNKEFPFDKWWRKHVTPGRFTIAILAMMAFTIWGPVFIPHGMGMTICTTLLAMVLIAAVPMLAWQISWHIKYPPQVEFCKECGRAKPIKYED